MRLAVILLATVLLACLAGVPGVTAQADPNPLISDLDSLKYQTNDLSNKVESELTDLNIYANTTDNTSATAGNDRVGMVQAASTHADGYDRQLSTIRQSFADIQNRYDPAKFGNRDATAIESRMSAIQNDIDRINNMINDMRAATDLIRSRG